MPSLLSKNEILIARLNLLPQKQKNTKKIKEYFLKNVFCFKLTYNEEKKSKSSKETDNLEIDLVPTLKAEKIIFSLCWNY
jgi:hypothetical protein